jgi:hypothetical protein
MNQEAIHIEVVKTEISQFDWMVKSFLYAVVKFFVRVVNG